MVGAAQKGLAHSGKNQGSGFVVTAKTGRTNANGLAMVISTLFLEAVGANLYLRTASEKSVLGLPFYDALLPP